MKYCVFCHQELEDDAVFCINCGKKQPEQADVTPDAANPGQQPGGYGNPEQQPGGYGNPGQQPGGYGNPGQQPGGYGNPGQQSGGYGNPGQQSGPYQGERINQQAAYQSAGRQGSRYGRQFASWCRIGRQQKSLYGASMVSEQEFMEKVDRQLKRKHVAASIRQQNVLVDGSERREYIIDFDHGRGDNPVALILKYMREGIYSYVQSGMYVTPPALPAKPGKEPEFKFRSDGVFGICAGLIVLLLGFGMANITSAISSVTNSGGGGGVAFLIIAGLGLVGWGGYQLFEFIRWFRAYRVWKKQNDMWNRAWDAWENNEFIYAAHEMDVGYMTFIYEAVIQCVQDVCHEVFDQGPVSESFAEVSDHELADAAGKRRSI